MPSIRSLLTGVAFTTFSLLQITSATPLPSGPGKDCGGPGGKPLALPVNGGAIELPASNLKLAYVAVGRGIQNYTCTTPGVKGVLLGAVATLYDGTALAHRDIKALHSLAPRAVYDPIPATNKPLSYPAPIGSLPVLGHHYFNSDGVPVFDLSTSREQIIIYAAKNQSIIAPATADKGPLNTGAVDWLFLDAKKDYTPSVGLKQVYRVVTAGGLSPICGNNKLESVQYATEYWLYK